MQRIDYLPIEYLFNLLCACRKYYGNRNFNYWAIIKERGLRSFTGEATFPARPLPRVSFWIRLAQVASILDEGEKPYPTLLADEWLSWSFYQQMDLLLKAWLKAPHTQKICDVRQRLVHSLRQGVTPGSAQRKEIIGLQVLGVCYAEQLTPIGRALIHGLGEVVIDDEKPSFWRIENNHLIVPFPPNWKLLWELERYLDPLEAGVYPLDFTRNGMDVLRVASQRKALESKPSLVEILTRGLGGEIPETILHRLRDEPVIRVISNIVLEFTDPTELKKLRQTRGMRQELERLISPRHVVLNPATAQKVLKKLNRKGLLTNEEIVSAEINRQNQLNNREIFTKAEKTFLLFLVLLITDLQNEVVPPPGLNGKLEQNIDQNLYASAFRKVKIVHQSIIQKIGDEIKLQAVKNSSDESGSEFSQPAGLDLIRTLEGAINRQESIGVMYQASGRHMAEYRQLTPLLIESRNDRDYLIAYCHVRRATRTFRLDRLKLIDVAGLSLTDG